MYETGWAAADYARSLARKRGHVGGARHRGHAERVDARYREAAHESAEPDPRKKLTSQGTVARAVGHGALSDRL